MKQDQINCKICGRKCHVIKTHLEHFHPEMSIEEYTKRFPDAPTMSSYAEEQIAKFLTERESKHTGNFLHHVFGLDTDEGAYSTVGHRPIPITVYDRSDEIASQFIPEINKDYIYNVQELKYVLYGIESNIPTYVWGHKGTGKTELIEQICARTNRPLLRVQHTVNTEESQIVGQWVVRGGEMEFELGPLPLAMINGWTYLADEYDFAMPNVLSVYQAVLEGKPLMIKEAPIEKRIIKPHPNFRFVATGNTNGTGDETGLYQGTTVQNSANYDRFGVVVHKKYLSKSAEIKILVGNTDIKESDATTLVDFATMVRDGFSAGKFGDTISPRTLLFAARIGYAHGSVVTGLRLAFLNKLSSTDREAADELIARLYGV